MSFSLKRTGDADYPKHLKILVMGSPKSGKTTFIATAPNMVVAAAEAGLMSIAHLNVPYIDVNSTDDLSTLLTILGDDTLRQQAAAKLGVAAIESVAIDTLDSYQDILKKEILKENRRTEMQQADWGKLKERMASLLKAFVDLPLNVIFTVHTTTTQDEESRQIYAPGLQGGIKDEIAGLVDFSLVSFRQRETANDGTSSVKYYLRNEGDLKNPHVGNRAAGRLPEICEPNFKILHDAVFKNLSLPKTATVDTGVETAAQKLAQSDSQSGLPADDSHLPINVAGIAAISKAYEAQGLTVPPDLKVWTLGQARQVARMFQSVKSEIAAGTGRIEDLYAYLRDHSIFYGMVADASPKKAPAKKAAAPKPESAKVVDAIKEEKEAVDSPDPAVEETSSDEDAVALAEKELGGVVVLEKITEDALCAECNKPVDDLDIANLSNSRYRKILCTAHYLAATRA